jgi:hypothetical protein
VLRRAGVPPPQSAARASKADPYVPFIRQTLERFPKLTASRVYAMVRERGYRGSPDHFRHIVAMHRPRPPAEAYLCLTTMAGESGQVDRGHFGHLQIGRARRPLMASKKPKSVRSVTSAGVVRLNSQNKPRRQRRAAPAPLDGPPPSRRFPQPNNFAVYAPFYSAANMK